MSLNININPPPEAINPGDTSIGNTIYNAAVYIGMVIAVFFIIYGGYQFLVSSGDSNKVKKAQDTITYAVIGLVVVVIAKILSDFIFNLLK